MNDMLQVDDRACWTGPTDKSNIDYPISQYFTNLEVRKTKFSTITVQQKQNITPIYHQKMVLEPIKPKDSTHKIATKPPKPSKPNVKKGSSSKQKKNDHKSK